MKIQYLSDLHLEFRSNASWIAKHPIPVIGDILVIAGDTHLLDDQYRKLDFFKDISDRFQQTYVIPGNHEFYKGYDVAVCEGKIHEDLLPNVKLIHNDFVYHKDIKLIFSTMWSFIEHFPDEISMGINDFRKINYKGNRLRISDFNNIHNKCMDFIEGQVSENGKKVVVTHHLPSVACNAEEHRDSHYNEAFCVDKTEFITQSDVSYWIYGHNHRVLPPIDLGGTKLLSNQLGYVDHFEHRNFDPSKCIDL
ncbi:metallophosphoesterase [Galbibacter sp.]|uniref:metallophosphoesterase n=1 Tax=Galbibacter sp. TaxID=2918471 RepID=UPI003A8D0EDC